MLKKLYWFFCLIKKDSKKSLVIVQTVQDISDTLIDWKSEKCYLELYIKRKMTKEVTALAQILFESIFISSR